MKITNTYNGNTVVKATNKVTGEIHSFKNFGNAHTGNSLSITNANTSLVPLNPNVSTGATITTSSSARTVTGSVGPNLITSGKSVTTLEAPKNPIVKSVTKPKQNIETVKQPAVTSEKPKTVEKSYSQGSNNHNSNKESFNQKTEKNPNRNSAGENYGTEKTSNKMPLFSNRENIHRNSNTPNYDYKVQDNSGSNGSSNGDSGSKKNIEPSVENSGKIYTLELQDANWNFSKDYIQDYESIVTAEPKIYDVTTNSYKLPNIDTGLSSVNANNIPPKNSTISMSYDSKYGQVINTPSSLTSKMQKVLNNGDLSGKTKEKIIKNTFNRDPRYKIHDGTYGNEKYSFDVVLEDKVDNTVWIIDSKPIKEPKRFNLGSTRVSNDGAGNTRQLSPNWIDTVINQKLDINHPTSILIKNARKNGDLRTGIMGINKNPNTGEPELILIPVNIKNK